MVALALAGACAACGGPTPAPGSGAPNGKHGTAHAAGQPAAAPSAVDRVLSYTPYIAVGSGAKREIALTFDDGPSLFTTRILAILRKARAPATFFAIGREADAHAAIERAVLAAGLPIGDHTQTHALLPRVSADGQRREIVQAAVALQRVRAPYPQLFRPPYGGFDANTLAQIKALHMLMVLWSVDTKDFSHPGVKRIIYTAVSGARPGAIVLMHDGGGDRAQTVAALPRIIALLRKRHYKLVTVPRLLIDDPPARNQRPPRSLSGTP